MIRICCALLAAATMLAASPLSAVTTILSPSADTFVDSGNRNFGIETFLRVRPSGRNRALIRFDQAAIGAALSSGVLVSATLELYVEDSNEQWASGREVDVHRLLQDWTELGVTFNCPVDSDTSNGFADCPVQWGGGNFAAAATDSRVQTNGFLGTVTYDVTNDVLEFLTGSPNFGWIVKKRDEGAGG